MSPSAEPTSLAPSAESLVPENLLEDGEIVLMAAHPSRWFVVLVSWPALLVAGTLAVMIVIVRILWGETFPLQVRPSLLVLTAVAGLRLLLAMVQWSTRLYVLTNRRAIRLRGGVDGDIEQCLLKQVAQVSVCAGSLQGRFGVADVLLTLKDGDACLQWECVAQPEDVATLVRQTIDRTH